MQRKLNSLQKYCDQWRLSVNESKTMIMQISKCGRLPTLKFKLNDVELMNTKVYKYLGVLFDSSGKFNQARLNMNDRGQKAMYKLKSAIDRTLIDPSVILTCLTKQLSQCVYTGLKYGVVSIYRKIAPLVNLSIRCIQNYP